MIAADPDALTAQALLSPGRQLKYFQRHGGEIMTDGKPMFEIGDLAGLSKPLTRLVEVIGEGIGGVSKPILTRVNANAKAHEIKTIANAIAESQKLLGPIEYKAGEIVIASTPGDAALQLPDASVDNRVLSRMAYQEAKKQNNLEMVTQYAANEFTDDDEVSDERPDSDWVTRFFRVAEDISSEHMQELWGKVLAGEVKQPGSFSLRALEILKNISQNEAETFVRVAQAAVRDPGSVIIPNQDRHGFLMEHFGVVYDDLVLLREIGLLVSMDLTYNLLETKKASSIFYKWGSMALQVTRPSNSPKFSKTAIFFTECGAELLQLVNQEEKNEKYIKHIYDYFNQGGLVLKAGEIIEEKDGVLYEYNHQYTYPAEETVEA